MSGSSLHVVLLGDSIFDNGAYTGSAPDVITHLRRLMPPPWRATLCAVDGATTDGLAAQLACVPADASHLVIAVGGNDALRHQELLSHPVASSAEALSLFAERLATFERSYRAAIAGALALGRRTIVCTVYNGALDPDLAEIARTGLALFNDVILRTAIDLRIDAIELRGVCTQLADYVHAIEPSASGGEKIARAVAEAVGTVRPAAPPARVWTRMSAG